MAQISRPFQVALVVILLIAGVGIFALQRHSTSPTSSSSSPTISVTHSSSAPASSGGSATLAQREAAKAAAPTPEYHGPAPGLQGLTRAVNKAHEAVANSDVNANKLQQQSRAASGESAGGDRSSSTPVSRTPAAPSSSHTGSTPAAVGAGTAASTASHQATKSTGSSSTSVPSAQRAVEAELHNGDVAVILFWNPSGFDDQLVHAQLQHLSASAGSGRFAVHASLAGEISSYGSITRGAQVYATPTILVVSPRGKVITINGMTDAYAIEQAIQEAHGA